MGRRVQGWISPGTLRDICNGVPETGRLSPQELCWGNLEGEGGSFSRSHEGYERKALGMDRGSVGQTVVSPSTGDFEIWLKRALEVECPSLWELCERNLKGGLPCWGP